MAGAFIISLDFELHWGSFEKRGLDKYARYFLNTREVIPRMLEAFTKHDVHATWAGVGFLFFDNHDELVQSLPQNKPTYRNQTLSAYTYIHDGHVGSNEREDPFHFARSLTKRIAGAPNQEVASHSFSHFYCNEPGQNTDQFREDLRAAQLAATLAIGKKLKSLVFPRNQFNDDYLKVCFDEGFVVVRDNPRDWFWNIQSTERESTWKRLNRGLDAYVPLGKKNTYRLDEIRPKEGLPICLPASRLLRPYRPSELFLNTMKINRICSEMERAAKAGEVYHLWWHPHNFGWYPEESMTGLERIMNCFEKCHQMYGMTSLSMGEVGALLGY